MYDRNIVEQLNSTPENGVDPDLIYAARDEILKLGRIVEGFGWRPIATAPQDDTPVDLWRPGYGGERCTNMRRVNMGGGNVFYDPVDSGSCCVRDATYWMSIPGSPENGKA